MKLIGGEMKRWLALVCLVGGLNIAVARENHASGPEKNTNSKQSSSSFIEESGSGLHICSLVNRPAGIFRVLGSTVVKRFGPGDLRKMKASCVKAKILKSKIDYYCSCSIAKRDSL